MTVQELIQELEQYPDDMEVLLAQQPTWPLEYSIHGVVSRYNGDGPEVVRLSPEDAEDYGGEWAVMTDDDGERVVEDAFDTEAEADAHANRMLRDRPDCVFILEGRQLRYASEDLWSR